MALGLNIHVLEHVISQVRDERLKFFLKMSERLQEVDKAPTMKMCASTNDTRRLQFF